MKKLIYITGIFVFGLLMTACNSSKKLAESVEEIQSEPQVEKKPANMEERAQRRANENEQMYAQLNLDSDQISKVELVMEKYGQKMQDMRTKHAGDRMAMRTEMMSIRKEQQTELNMILSESQQKEYQLLLEKRRAESRSGMGERSGQRGTGGNYRQGTDGGR